MRVECAEQYLEETPKPFGKKKDRSEVSRGTQFTNRRVLVRAIVGRLCRILDMTNMEERYVVGMVTRLLVKLRIQNYSGDVIRTAVFRAVPRAWCDLAATLVCLSWDSVGLRL